MADRLKSDHELKLEEEVKTLLEQLREEKMKIQERELYGAELVEGVSTTPTQIHITINAN